MNTYSFLSASLTPVPKGEHQIVRLENPLLASPIEAYAHFAPKALTKSEAKAWAESLDIGDLSFRLPGEEGLFMPDRSKWPCFDPTIFLGARNAYPAIWLDVPDPEAPASCSFVVGLYGGDVGRYRHDNRCRALAVRAGQ